MTASSSSRRGTPTQAKRSYKYIEYGCVKKEDQESNVYYAFPEMRYERLVSISSDEEKQAKYFLDYIKLLVEDREEYVQLGW